MGCEIRGLGVVRVFYPRKFREDLVSLENCGRVFRALLENLPKVRKSHSQVVPALFLPRVDRVQFVPGAYTRRPRREASIWSA